MLKAISALCVVASSLGLSTLSTIQKSHRFAGSLHHHSPAKTFCRSAAAPLFSTSSVSEEASATIPTQRNFSIPTTDVILYDGVCNFCNAWVDILLRLDVNEKFRFAPLQSSVGRRLLAQIGKDENDISSVVLVRPNGQYFTKSSCVLQVLGELGLPGPLAERIIPTSLRDFLYDGVAQNRYNILGRRDQCRCSDPIYAKRFLLDWILKPRDKMSNRRQGAWKKRICSS